MAESFADRFATVRSERGPLVWGLDPSGDLLDAWGLGDTADGLDRFADIVIEAAVGTVGLIKPQSAFYERHGWRGVRTLGRLMAEARSAGLLVVLDVKRGDVGTTNDAYAEAFLGKGAPLEADAITVHPYLGLGAMGAFVTRAHEAGACLLVVTRSSNLEGRAVQAAVDESGRRVEEVLLAEIGRLNAVLAPGEIGPIGAVVAPTHLDTADLDTADLDTADLDTADLGPANLDTAHLPPANLGAGLDLLGAHGLFLAPGVGTQGATVADVARMFATCPDRVMPSASRSLLVGGPDRSRLRDDATALAAELGQVLTG